MVTDEKMTTVQRIPIIEEINLLSDSDSDDEVIIINDIPKVKNQPYKSPTEIQATSPAPCIDKQKFVNLENTVKSWHKPTGQVFCTEDYVDSNNINSNASVNNEKDTRETSISQFLHEPLNDISNVRNVESDEEQLYIDEDSDNELNETDNFLINEIYIPKQSDNLLTNDNQVIEQMTKNISSDDEFEINQEDILIVQIPQKKTRVRGKNYLLLHCEKCNLTKQCSFNSIKDNHCKCGALQSFKCKTCKSSFKTYCSAIQHLKKKCLSDRYWHCPECNYASSTSLKLEEHIKNKHYLPKRCTICKAKIFKTKTDLVKHKCSSLSKKTTLQKTFYRPRCNFKISKVKEKIHKIKTKSGFIKAFSKMTKTKDTMDLNTSHETSNLQDLANACCLKCKITFKKEESITIRYCNNCSGSLAFNCIKCNEYVTSICALYDHFQNKCEYEEYTCLVCNKKFEVSNIKNHKDCEFFKQYKNCKHCDFKTNFKKYFRIHAKREHSKEMKKL